MRDFTRSFLCFVLLLTLCRGALAHPGDSTQVRRWYTPHHVHVQFAGNIGFLSTGLGYSSRNQNYELVLIYGHVPRSIAKASIHMVTAKNNFLLGRFLLKTDQTLIPYLGLGLTVEVSGNAFFRQPDHFPEDYYKFPKNLHVIAYGGVRAQHLLEEEALLRGLEFFAEAGTIDAYIWYKTISSEIKLNEIFTLALGVNFLLGHR